MYQMKSTTQLRTLESINPVTDCPEYLSPLQGIQEINRPTELEFDNAEWPIRLNARPS
jgi:hypothetical protein